MPRSKNDTTLTRDDIDRFLFLTESYETELPSGEREIMLKMRKWAKKELERRLAAGKAGGRPKKAQPNEVGKK